MIPGSLWRASATELAEAIRTGQVSSAHVVKEHLERIAAVNPAVNAVTAVLEQDALAAADAADQALAAGQPVGPLHGVPITVKEGIDVAGSATTQGVAAFANAIAPLDAPHIARLRAAGAIPIGRTNMPDFGMRWHTDNALHGATVNPWSAGRSPGGSSGGDAVAVATGMTPLGIGSDYGGSLRIPAQACGVAALRPTLGRVPWATSVGPPDFPLTIQLFGVQGPVARRVGDLFVALEVMSGLDPRDPWSSPAPLSGPSTPARVAVTTDPAGLGVDPDVASAVDHAALRLSGAGYDVEYVDPPAVAEAADLWGQLVTSDLEIAFLPLMQQVASADALAFLQLLFNVRPPVDRAAYAMAWAARNGIARAWAEFHQQYPLVLGPVATIQPQSVGFDIAGTSEVQTLMEAHRLVLAVNLLGLPAACVPVGVANGLPQSVQLIGPRYREDLCLYAARAIEDHVGTITPIDPL